MRNLDAAHRSLYTCRCVFLCCIKWSRDAAIMASLPATNPTLAGWLAFYLSTVWRARDLRIGNETFGERLFTNFFSHYGCRALACGAAIPKEKTLMQSASHSRILNEKPIAKRCCCRREPLLVHTSLPAAIVGCSRWSGQCQPRALSTHTLIFSFCC